ncbi:Transcription factor STP2 [Nakaseomyces bracarensis]|uniref:Transcription factor STP2 n=1 Tax=Nakaseomyces bracarensis TaxID=273131 RepID=A0ABR4NPJ4_9SACH
MPVLSLLKPHSLWRVVRDLIDTVIIPDENGGFEKPRQAKKYRKRITKKREEKEEEEEERNRDKEEEKDEEEEELFPKITYDKVSLGSAVPCSMDMSMPISFSFNNNVIESQFELPDLQIQSQPHPPSFVLPSTNLDEMTQSQVQAHAQAQPQAQPLVPTMEVKKEESNLESESNDEDKEFVCHYCDAKFRIRGYLTRHIKKHALEKAYHCPFYDSNESPSKRCHNSGGFSRRDTFKTHMKARHLIYPEGVKFADRNQSSGHCARCGTFIPKASRFVEDHLESGLCPALPLGYVSENLRKSSKDSSVSPSISSSSSVSPDATPFSNKSLPPASRKTKRRNRMKKIITSNGTCRYISTLQSWVEPKVLQNKEALEAMAIMASETGRNDVLTTLDDNKFVLDGKNYVSSKSSNQSNKQEGKWRKGSKDSRGKGASKSKIKANMTTVSPTCATVKLEHTAEGLISPANSTSSGTMSTSPMSQNTLEPVYSDSSFAGSLDSIQNNHIMAKMETNATAVDQPLPNMVDLDKIGFDAMLAYFPLDQGQASTSDNRNMFGNNSNDSLNQFNDNNNYHAGAGFGMPQHQQQQQNVMRTNQNVVMPSANNGNFTQPKTKGMESYNSFDAATLTEMHIRETQKYMQYYQQFFNTN